MVVAIVASSVLAISLVAEWLHWRRTRRMAHLAFGPKGRASLLGRLAPLLRIAAQTALGWGLATLLIIPPQTVATGDASTETTREGSYSLGADGLFGLTAALADAFPDLDPSE
ncbi:MAG: hypothetical protein ACK557_23805, partial [Planctomycetota bacterium]